MSKSPFFSRIASLLTTARKRPIGYDLEGNKYYEAPDPNGGRMKRTVEYKVEKDIADYTEGTSRLPVQWTTWLSHTRTKPPTIEELQADFHRQQSLGPMIAAIEERERAERIRQGYLIETPEGEVVAQIAGPSRTGNGWTKADGPLFRAAPSNAPSNERVATPKYHDASPSRTKKPDGAESPAQTAASSIASPRETADPISHNTAEELRQLAMEDTKRRMKDSGMKVEGEQKPAVGGAVSSGLQPRRRGGG